MRIIGILGEFYRSTTLAKGICSWPYIIFWGSILGLALLCFTLDLLCLSMNLVL